MQAAQMTVFFTSKNKFRAIQVHGYVAAGGLMNRNHPSVKHWILQGENCILNNAHIQEYTIFKSQLSQAFDPSAIIPATSSPLPPIIVMRPVTVPLSFSQSMSG